MMEPREIEDEGHERVLERVAAIDVAKASGMVCVRVPHESRPGRRVSRVWEVAATTGAVTGLGDHLVCQGIEKVTVESTSDYWRIWFYLLEAAGLDVQLVKAQEARHLPGRPKTDTLDSVWQAKCTERGVLRPSFRAPGTDPRAAGLHPAAHRPDPGADPALVPAGEAARRRADQGVGSGQHDDHQVGPRHDRGADRRRAQPPGAGRPGPRQDEGQAGRADRGAERQIRRSITPSWPRMLLDQIDALTAQIGTLTSRIEELIGAMTAARGVNADGTTGPGSGHRPRRGRRSRPWPVWMRSPASPKPAHRSSSPRQAWT